MERPMITLDELMSMSEKEINEFIDRDEQLLAEGLIDENQPNIDLMGMSDEEIAQKYGYTPMNVVYDRIMQKLNRWLSNGIFVSSTNDDDGLQERFARMYAYARFTLLNQKLPAPLTPPTPNSAHPADL